MKVKTIVIITAIYDVTNTSGLNGEGVCKSQEQDFRDGKTTLDWLANVAKTDGTIVNFTMPVRTQLGDHSVSPSPLARK